MPKGPVPARFHDILQSTTVAHLATIGADGRPQVNPVWFLWDGEHVLLSVKGIAVKYHNIVGLVPRDGFVARLSEEGDGVVGFTSAHLEEVDSELVVASDHLNVHRHPLAILEVRRILLEHAAELDAAQAMVAPPSFP